MSDPHYTLVKFPGPRSAGYVEVYRDGEPFHIGPGFSVPPLRMDLEQATVISESWNVIERFFNSNGKWPGAGAEERVLPTKGQESAVYWKWHPKFKDGAKVIDRPYLQAHAAAFFRKRYIIAFGMDKAAGLLACRNEIDEFADGE